MAVDIQSIIDVNVTLGSAAATAKSFTSAAFVAEVTDAAMPEAYLVFTSLQAVLAKFATTTKVYKFAQKAFSGKFKPESIYVIKYNGSKTPVQALTEIRQLDTKPYFIASDTRVNANITALQTYCEAEKLMFVTATQVAGAIDVASTTDIAFLMKQANTDHGVCLYSGVADAEFPEGGIIGAIAGVEAGTTTLEFKTMPNVVADNLNDTQQTALLSKNALHYQNTAGLSCLYNTKTSSGQFIDTVIFADWLKARLGESLFNLLYRESNFGRKVSMDDEGFNKVRSAISEVLTYGKRVGSISKDMEPIIRIPKREEILAADRANRVLPNVAVELLYTNGVHKVKVNVYVSI